jgi:spore coat protein U-like protein
MGWSRWLGAALLPLLAVALMGSTTTDTESVTATVTQMCSVSSPIPLAFGNYDPVVTNRTTPLEVAIAAISVACTRGSTGVTIGLGASANTASCPTPSGQRCLLSGTNVLDYQIYTTSGYSTIWESPNTVSYSSTSMAASLFTVYGEIPAGQNAVVSASYTDTVVATVNF